MHLCLANIYEHMQHHGLRGRGREGKEREGKERKREREGKKGAFGPKGKGKGQDWRISLALAREKEVAQFLKHFWVPISNKSNVSRCIPRIFAGVQAISCPKR